MRAPLAVLLAVVACSKPSAPAGPALEAPLGRYRVVSASNPPTGLTVGTLLEVNSHEVVVINDERSDAARMKVQWRLPQDPLALSGVLASGEHVLLRLVGGRLEVMEDDALLGTAERLEGRDEEAASRRFAALPSFEVVLTQARECFRQYEVILPTDLSFRDVKPEGWASTSSGKALLGLAELNLVRACKGVPPACVLEPRSRAEIAALNEAADRCGR